MLSARVYSQTTQAAQLKHWSFAIKEGKMDIVGQSAIFFATGGSQPHLLKRLFMCLFLVGLVLPCLVWTWVAASGSYSLLGCSGFSLWWVLLLHSMGFRCRGFGSFSSQALECGLSSCHGLSCSEACEIFPDNRLNPCPLHWQDSHPLYHWGSPLFPTVPKLTWSHGAISFHPSAPILAHDDTNVTLGSPWLRW